MKQCLRISKAVKTKQRKNKKWCLVTRKLLEARLISIVGPRMESQRVEFKGM